MYFVYIMTNLEDAVHKLPHTNSIATRRRCKLGVMSRFGNVAMLYVCSAA